MILNFDNRTLDCVGRTEDNSVPEAATPSKVDVTFGQYENTSYWYVNVSWTPINGKQPRNLGSCNLGQELPSWIIVITWLPLVTLAKERLFSD